MAGFRTHVGTSSALGCGYAGVLHALYGVPLPSATVAGAMCGFSGMLPDLDSDHSVPLHETMAFSAATIPMMLIAHFQTLGLSRDAMILSAVGLYFAVRFGATHMIRRFTVHRGMFHSVPAMVIFGGIAFLLSGSSPLDVRCYKAGGVMGGFFSHLLLDEIWAVEFKSGRWRRKKSFGTAMKLWGDNSRANVTTYSKLAIVGMMIMGDPTIVQQLQAQNPQLASEVQQWQTRIGALPGGQQALEAAHDASQYVGSIGEQPTQNAAPSNPLPPVQLPPNVLNDWNTAQRAAGNYPQ